MEEFSKDCLRMLETVANEVEQFFSEFSKEATEAFDAFTKFSEEVAEQFQTTVFTEIDQGLDDLFEPFLEVILGLEGVVEDAVEPVTQTVEPILNQHPVCSGCRNYHGQVYGGNVLICAMHPYGWDGESCPDWESVWAE